MNKSVKNIFVRMLDIRQEKDDEPEITESIRKGIEFKGTNLWVLIFAVFLASLGLNTNSTAVIIGAMLISPLMGPIMGFGFGLGVIDFDMIKRSARNFAVATVFSIITSTFYFFISPVSEAQSELLARTSPTVYDVLIAFFGGLAGVVAGSTRLKGNAIPGVAIATALMPPLCTAGFGIATGNFGYFIGALYLYFINTVFIGLSTYLVVRLLKYPQKQFLDKRRERKVKRYIAIIAVCTIIPSIYLSYNLFGKTFFDGNVRGFISSELNFDNAQVLKYNVVNTRRHREINVLLIGGTVPEDRIAAARSKMPAYKLKDVDLVVRQGFGNEEVDVDKLKSALMQDLYANSEKTVKEQQSRIDSMTRRLETYKASSDLPQTILPEIKVIFPEVETLSCSHTLMVHADSERTDTVLLFYVDLRKAISEAERHRMKAWIMARTKETNIKLITGK